MMERGGCANSPAPLSEKSDLMPRCISQQRRRLPVLCVAAIAIAVTVAGCAPTGDFGRRQPSYFHDTVIPAVRTAAHDIRGKLSSRYPYTADEERMRALSHNLIHVDRKKSIDRYLASGVQDLGIAESRYEENRRIANNTGKSAYERQPPSRRPYTLLNVVRADIWDFRLFGNSVELVYAADARRRRAILKREDVPSSDLHNAIGRINENRRVVNQTLLAVRNRVDEYRLELRRSILEYPDAIPEGRVTAAIDRLAGLLEIIQDQTRVWAFPNDYVRNGKDSRPRRDRIPKLDGGRRI